MTMQSRLNSSSLATLAIIAGKALQQVYSYMKNTTIAEEDAEYVVSAPNGEKLVRLYRQDNADGTFTHSWDEYESDTFIVQDYEGEQEYRVYSLVYEFEEYFFEEIILHQELPITNYPDELIRDLVNIIRDCHDRVTIKFTPSKTLEIGDIHLMNQGEELMVPLYCYKAEHLVTLLEEIVKLHNIYYE